MGGIAINKIILCGRLTRDAELKTANSGTELSNFSIAVDRRFKGQDGTKQTDFFNCTAFSKTAVFISTYFRKGDGITIEGRMESRKYTDRDGNNRIAWEVICDGVEFPLSRPSDGRSVNDSTGTDGFTDVPEEDLPF